MRSDVLARMFILFLSCTLLNAPCSSVMEAQEVVAVLWLHTLLPGPVHLHIPFPGILRL